ncbi:CBO0543 family protein [Paenibacillus humicola]|uniref:CBO0543 family protein n=1 Tax=Paenibacillus humicola TaxID=3110540 RepID=UPI00237A89D8|nr:CBO0543 family protein [Paenibacillus humicola]
MHVAIAAGALLASLIWGDWRRWRDYRPAMMYFAIGNLLYLYLCSGHMLWTLKPDLFPKSVLTEVIYTFVTFPLTALLFLSNYPKRTAAVIFHYVQWIALYAGVEWLLSLTGRIVYSNGWSFWWSLLFDVTLFPMLRLFYRRELLAYVFSVGLTILWLVLFRVPMNGAPAQ